MPKAYLLCELGNEGLSKKTAVIITNQRQKSNENLMLIYKISDGRHTMI